MCEVAMLRAGEFTYEPTQEDVLWLRRAVAFEGAPQLEVAATLVNGFMWAASTGRWKKPLWAWVQAYAQPVNPAWANRGTPDEIARRQRARTMTVFGPSVRAAVDAALTSAPRYPGATDYAAPELRHAPPWKQLTVARGRENVLWTRPAALGWRGYVADAAGASGGAAALLVAVFGGLLLLRA